MGRWNIFWDTQYGTKVRFWNTRYPGICYLRVHYSEIWINLFVLLHLKANFFPRFFFNSFSLFFGHPNLHPLNLKGNLMFSYFCFFCQSVCLSVCLSVLLSVCLSVCLSIFHFMRISEYQYIIDSVRQPFGYLFLSICLSVFVSHCLSVCLSVFLSMGMSDYQFV